MSVETILTGVGIALLVIYFVRRMYWLSMANRHNLVTDEPDLAAKETRKAHDWFSWLLLGAGALLVLGAGFLG